MNDLTLATTFVEDHPEEAAAVLEQLAFGDTAALLSSLAPELAAQTLTRISPSLAVDCLRSMDSADLVRILQALPLDLATRLLRRATEETRNAWLGAIRPEMAELLRRKLRYPPGTAGAVADPLVLALPDSETVGTAQRELRRSPERAYYYLYVLDREHRLLGALDIRELMLADTKALLTTVMHRDIIAVPATTDLGTVMVHPGWGDLDALPIVDAEGVFFGIIRHRTIRKLAGYQATRQQGDPMLNTVVSIGELYWAGLSAFLSGMGPAEPPQQRTPRMSGGWTSVS
jgi:magnesium transporter